jgi:hypothetical protein
LKSEYVQKGMFGRTRGVSPHLSPKGGPQLAAEVGLSQPIGVRPFIAAFPISLALFACTLCAGQNWAQMGESGDE